MRIVNKIDHFKRLYLSYRKLRGDEDVRGEEDFVDGERGDDDVRGENWREVNLIDFFWIFVCA